MKARIYKPSKTTMQSGRGNTKAWVLEYETESARVPEDLMGWCSSEDTLNQVKMRFDTKDGAIKFAQSKGFSYTVSEETHRCVVPKNYSDNFQYQPLDE